MYLSYNYVDSRNPPKVFLFYVCMRFFKSFLSLSLKSVCLLIVSELKCVAQELVCNGETDCIDGSDETHCVDWECLTTHWKCSHNKTQCILGEQVCANNYKDTQYFKPFLYCQFPLLI